MRRQLQEESGDAGRTGRTVKPLDVQSSGRSLRNALQRLLAYVGLNFQFSTDNKATLSARILTTSTRIGGSQARLSGGISFYDRRI